MSNKSVIFKDKSSIVGIPDSRGKGIVGIPDTRGKGQLNSWKSRTFKNTFSWFKSSWLKFQFPQTSDQLVVRVLPSPFSVRGNICKPEMPGTKFPAKMTVLKQLRPARGRSLGVLTSSTPKKQEDENNLGDQKPIREDTSEPIVAFNRPPWPPVMGSIVALSLLQMGSRSDDD